MTAPQKPLNRLLDHAEKVSATGLVYGDIKLDDTYGHSIVIWDAEPEEIETDTGDRVTVQEGRIVAAGMGATLDAAIAAAEAGMKAAP